MVLVLKRVIKRHPDITQEEVVGAWWSRIKTQYRIDSEKEYMVAVGVSPNGRLLEMIASEDEKGTIVIFHAMKVTKKVLVEVGML